MYRLSRDFFLLNKTEKKMINHEFLLIKISS